MTNYADGRMLAETEGGGGIAMQVPRNNCPFVPPCRRITLRTDDGGPKGLKREHARPLPADPWLPPQL